MKQRRDRIGTDLSGLDDLLQHRTRLTVAVLLSRHEQLSFSRLKHCWTRQTAAWVPICDDCEDGGYVAVRKEFQERKPVSWYRLTAKGRRALTAHLEGLGRLIDHAMPKDD